MWESQIVTNGDRYEPGIPHVKRVPGISFDAHNDHLGTLRGQSDSGGLFATFPVHTAFGEDMTNTGQRFGYAGSSGYQTNVNFDSLHVGERYYDPSSGRFLQRDPIGINGGINVYAYVGNSPQHFVDPNGLNVVGDFLIGVGISSGFAGGVLHFSSPSLAGQAASGALRAFGAILCGAGVFINFITTPPQYIRLPSRSVSPPITDYLGPSGIYLLPPGSRA